VAKPKTGKLTITVHQAQKLYDTAIGTQDPYIQLQCGEVKYKSRVAVGGGRSGTFEQAFLFQLKGNEFGVNVEALAQKALGDEQIGRAGVPLTQFFVKKLEPTWIRLGRDNGGKTYAGEVLVSSEWLDDSKEEEQKEAMVQQLAAQLLFYQQALAQKFHDADVEAKAAEQKITELTATVAELTGRVTAQTATIGQLTSTIDTFRTADQKLKTASASLEAKLDALRPAPFTEEYYENQRYQPLSGWKIPYLPKDRKPFTDTKGNEWTRNIIHDKMPKGWNWANDWDIDVNPKVDKDGWMYGVDFLVDSWHPQNQKSDTVRRRRWARTRHVPVDPKPDNKPQAQG